MKGSLVRNKYKRYFDPEGFAKERIEDLDYEYLPKDWPQLKNIVDMINSGQIRYPVLKKAEGFWKLIKEKLKTTWDYYWQSKLADYALDILDGKIFEDVTSFTFYDHWRGLRIHCGTDRHPIQMMRDRRNKWYTDPRYEELYQKLNDKKLIESKIAEIMKS